MKTKYKYICFIRFDRDLLNDSKSIVWVCYNNKNMTMLGEVKWFSNWRQYCFYPSADVIFNDSYMLDIVDFIKQLKES